LPPAELDHIGIVGAVYRDARRPRIARVDDRIGDLDDGIEAIAQIDGLPRVRQHEAAAG